ncbi:MBL fold metallo-hydrolase [Leekyejoonella antrihumi]|uniref:MBL fold metallo-hydrolase n=1 Tax=Leekyejoonella antrihumi TaxID=1660198 RepID=A0A563DTS0_9MICO|nr:MBL fold metallo-hydrolase [Leekyejoonella antrihumi]TWP33322.1 MBL fold metallo-hydrolase [Leekyejoonella antrihumi]
MKLTVVGCSGSFAGADSPASCYLVRAEHEGRTWNLVVDLGNGALGALQRHLDLDAIDAIVLSHLHPDHCLDLCGLFVVQKFNPARGGIPARRIPVYGPADTAARMSRANGVTLPESQNPRGLDPEFDFRRMVSGVPFTLGPFTVRPGRVNHPVEAFGMRIEADGTALCYTGDTDSCPALGVLMRDTDLVLVDSAFQEGRDRATGIHLSGRRAAQAAVDAGGVRRLMLTHIPPWNDVQVSVDEAKAVWPGEVEVAAAGMTYEI